MRFISNIGEVFYTHNANGIAILLHFVLTYKTHASCVSMFSDQGFLTIGIFSVHKHIDCNQLIRFIYDTMKEIYRLVLSNFEHILKMCTNWQNSS